MPAENNRRDRFRQAETLVRLGLVVNAALMVAKLPTGYFGKSEALTADGFESACGLAISAASLAAARASSSSSTSNLTWTPR